MPVGSDAERRVAGIAVLDRPVRRDLYRLLAASGEWVSRDQAAALVGVPRSVVAFHLDKLAEVGVLEVRYERMGDRRGPGAGRPAKLYRVTEGEMWASVPDRRYDFAGSILAEAVEESAGTGTPISLCVARAARDRGRVVAQDPGGSSIRDLLDRCGYQPTSGDDGELLLGNCPFNRLAESHRDLVCGMNLDFVTGLIEGAGASTTMVALLDQAPGRCCVKAVAPAS